MVETWPIEIMEALLLKFYTGVPEKHLFFAHEGVPTRAQLYDFLKRHMNYDLENRRESELWADFNNSFLRYAAHRKATQLNLNDLRDVQGYDTYITNLKDLMNNTGALTVTDEQVRAISAEIAQGAFDPLAVIVPSRTATEFLKQLRPGNLVVKYYWQGTAISEDGKYVFAMYPSSSPTTDYKIIRSENGGISWSAVTMPLKGMDARIIMNKDASIMYALNENGEASCIVYRSTDYGLTWTAQPLGDITHLRYNGLRTGYVSDDGNTIYVFSGRGKGAAKSTDAGVTWKSISPLTVSGTNFLVAAVSADGSVIIVPEKDTWHKSTDGGETWVVNTFTGASSMSWHSGDISDDGSTVVLYSNRGIFISKDTGTTWEVKPHPFPTQKGSYKGGMVTYDGKKMSAIYYNSDKAIYSEDSGDTWSLVTLPISNRWYEPKSNSFGTIVAVGYATDTIIRSHDAGKTWLKSEQATGEFISTSSGGTS